MSPFLWHVFFVCSMCFFVFSLSAITMSLLLVKDVRENDVKDYILTYVEVANWIYVGLLGVCVLVAISFSKYITYYNPTISIRETGLHPATPKRMKND